LDDTSFEYYGTGNAIPVEAWTAPEGSWRVWLPYVKTIATWKW